MRDTQMQHQTSFTVCPALARPRRGVLLGWVLTLEASKEGRSERWTLGQTKKIEFIICHTFREKMRDTQMQHQTSFTVCPAASQTAPRSTPRLGAHTGSQQRG